MSAELNGAALYVKRDDCTGLAFGGNKIRQLEFYLGEAIDKGADTALITGAVQSNFVRSTAAAAAKLGLACHVQLEARVPDTDDNYRRSGNVLLDQLFGATISYYDQGEDEEGADRRIREQAEQLRQAGRNPYVIPLAPGHPPLGALGYVLAAAEIVDQLSELAKPITTIVVASGSGHTHAGLLFGLRALGCDTEVIGICVRRAAALQVARIRQHCDDIAALLGIVCPVNDTDIQLDDAVLAPGYGQLNEATIEAIELAARREGLVVDPTYTGKSLAGAIRLGRAALPDDGRAILFVHTGGQPAVFAYQSHTCRRTWISKRNHDDPPRQSRIAIPGDGSGRE